MPKEKRLVKLEIEFEMSKDESYTFSEKVKWLKKDVKQCIKDSGDMVSCKKIKIKSTIARKKAKGKIETYNSAQYSPYRNRWGDFA